MQRAKQLSIKILVVLAVFATVLVPALVAPAKTISLPETMAATKALGRPEQAPQRVMFRFPATHIAFAWTGIEGSGVRFRTVAADGTKGPWQRALEAHDAERGDQHFSGVTAVDRIAGVIWQSSKRGGRSIGPVTLDYLNTLDGDRYTEEVPAVAQAGNTPDIVTRAEWGANESIRSTTGSCRRTFNTVQQLFVHHTAGANFDTRPKATMRAIYWYHTVRQRWCDIGYNFVVAPSGTIFEGRWARKYAPFEEHDSEDREGRVVTGAHVSGFNSGSVGISLMGNYSKVELPPAARKSLAELLAWEADRHNLNPEGTHTYRNPDTGATKKLPYIAGHRDAGDTECPGGFLYAAMPAIRRDAKTAMGAGKADSDLTLTPTAPIVAFGESATFTGVLRGAGKVPLAGKPIRSYMKAPGAQWAPGPSTVTGTDGSYSLTITPRTNTRVVSIYDGDATTWGDDSNVATVMVRPEVTLTTDGGTEVGGVATFPPGTTVVPLSGTVRPWHVGQPVVVRVSRVNPDGTYTFVARTDPKLGEKSRYGTGFEVPDTMGGNFRAITWFRGDADHPRAPSPDTFFVVNPSP